MTRDLELIQTAASINGVNISPDAQQYLEKFARQNALLRVEIGSGPDFSKPMQFFANQPGKFQYLRGDKLVPFGALNGGPFIAFKVKNRALIVFGYFPGEYK